MKYGAPEYSSLTSVEPIPEMAVNNNDITLIVIYPNGIVYERPVNDPLFSAHKSFLRRTDDGNLTYYASDYPFLVIGCEAQVSDNY